MTPPRRSHYVRRSGIGNPDLVPDLVGVEIRGDSAACGLSLDGPLARGDLRFIGSPDTSPEEPAALWVDDDAVTPSPPGTGCDDAGYSSIQAAVDAAAPGDVIRVCPGAYTENVAVAVEDLTVVSTGGAAVTTVQAAASASVFLITSPGVSLDGFTVVPAGVADGDIGITGGFEGVLDASLVNNDIVGGRIGINIGCTSSGTSIANNTLSGQTEGGINIDTCEAPPFPGSSQNSVHHNTACGATATASIALGGSSNDNNVHHNTVTSISVFGSGNQVHHNTTELPIVDNGSGSTLQQNTVDPDICP